MTKHIQNHQTPDAGVTFRAVTIGLILIPVNIYFIMANHLKYWSTLPTNISLIYNVVITVVMLAALNFLLQRVWPRLVMKQGELLIIYVMLSIASAIAGHDMMQTVVPTIPNGFWFATPENEWKEIFWRHLPSWLTSSNLSSLKYFYVGETTFYDRIYFNDWLRPIIWWALLLTILIWVMVCLDLLLRKQWIERERLSYPIVQLPLEITRPDGWLFRSKMMWLGFAIAGGIDLINGTHVFFPIFPEIPVHQAEISRYFTEKPWNAMGWTPLYILPFGVGLGFLIPLEMSFSLWVFYLFWKGERILGKAMGLQNFPGFPYDGPQGLGAYLAIACFALYSGRRHFYTILKNIFQFNRRSDILSCQFDKSREWTEYRWTVLGLVVGLCLLGVFSYKGGMALWTAGLYFLIYYLLAIGITRIRAEVGPPTHEMFVIHPRQFLISVLGTRHISHPSLTMMSLYYTFNRGYRAHPMPHTLEGFKLSDTAKMRSGPFVLAMMLAVVAGIFASFWAYLVVSYKIGANPGLGSGGYNLLRTWLYFPKETDFPSVIFICLGFLFTGFIWWMRTRFVFWPFHPAGYAIASSIWTFGWLWFSIFVSWAIKVILLRIGGIRLYHKMLPFFLGLLLGEFIIGGAWVLVRLFWNITVYSFYR